MKPEPIYLDPYGTFIQVGNRVAYNYQGEVRLGSVVSIKITKRKSETRRDKTTFEVVEDRTKKISKVSRPSNLVVLAK